MNANIEKLGNLTVKTEVVEDGAARKNTHKGLSESQINELKTAFSMLDKNQDGRVNLSEMKHMLSSLGIPIEDSIVEALMQQASERDDGLVSEEEFLRWMAAQEEIGGHEDDLMDDLLAAFRDELKMAMDLIGEPVTEVQLDEMLKATDIDHDGRINYEEFVKILL
ncbi:unnamed protein product [Larinioides sclopetarius]|uniref:EF-hand domain-containing protein n=1 Tax=Larinioides sclopetarius TaxID=280406 RepID=A0AAV2AEZ0_9ARAC